MHSIPSAFSQLYFPTMGIFTKQRGLKLASRTNTTVSFSVPPQQDFSFIASHPHIISVDHVLSDSGVSANDGLSKNEAVRRLESYGDNLLQGKGGVSAWRVLVGQLGEYSGPNNTFCVSQKEVFSKCFDCSFARCTGLKFRCARFY